jgi:hypothetical protein
MIFKTKQKNKYSFATKTINEIIVKNFNLERIVFQRFEQSIISIIFQKKNHFVFYPPPLFFILSLLFHIFFIHPISLPSSFSISPSSSFSLISPDPFHMCSIVSLASYHVLHLLSSPSVQYLFSLSSFPHLNLAIIFLSLAFSVRRYSGISPVIHLSYFLFCLDFLILSLLCCLSVSLSLSLSSIFIYLLFVLNLSTSSLAYPFLVFFSFLSSIPLVSGTLLFHSFFLKTLPFSFPLSLSTYSSYTLSSLCNLAFLCPLKYFSCTLSLSTSSFLFLPSRDLCPGH